MKKITSILTEKEYLKIFSPKTKLISDLYFYYLYFIWLITLSIITS